jgi:hypothetical protein
MFPQMNLPLKSLTLPMIVSRTERRTKGFSGAWERHCSKSVISSGVAHLQRDDLSLLFSLKISASVSGQSKFDSSSSTNYLFIYLFIVINCINIYSLHPLSPLEHLDPEHFNESDAQPVNDASAWNRQVFEVLNIYFFFFFF